ncbi:MAG: methyltransferase, partial [Steroidobacteraceae bacterium]
IAAARLANAGLAARVVRVGGSFLEDPLPRGCDAATLVRVLHDHDDAHVRTLLRAVRTALEPGGTLVVAEPMAGTPGSVAMGDAYFGFYLHAMGSGRPRTAAELAQLLQEAGFTAIEERATARPLLVRVLTARNPGCQQNLTSPSVVLD